MIFSLLKSIFSFLTGYTFVKFISKAVWIVFLAAITYFFMTKYFLFYITSNYSQKTISSIERKFSNKMNQVQKSISTKKIIKKLNNMKDKLSKSCLNYQRQK